MEIAKIFTVRVEATRRILTKSRTLWRNKPVELNIAIPGELVKIHLIAKY